MKIQRIFYAVTVKFALLSISAAFVLLLFVPAKAAGPSGQVCRCPPKTIKRPTKTRSPAKPPTPDKTPDPSPIVDPTPEPTDIPSPSPPPSTPSPTESPLVADPSPISGPICTQEQMGKIVLPGGFEMTYCLPSAFFIWIAIAYMLLVAAYVVVSLYILLKAKNELKNKPANLSLLAGALILLPVLLTLLGFLGPAISGAKNSDSSNWTPFGSFLYVILPSGFFLVVISLILVLAFGGRKNRRERRIRPRPPRKLICPSPKANRKKDMPRVKPLIKKWKMK
jgi:hypothetical protein